MKNQKGFTLIELLVVILILGILIAIVVPNYSSFQERGRRTAVKAVMHSVQLVIEAYSVDHMGNYPLDAYVFDPTAPAVGDPICYFPEGNPDLGTAGLLPVNPYTGIRYNTGVVDDNLTYSAEGIQDLAAADPGAVRSDDALCPYGDLTSYPEEASYDGTIGVMIANDGGDDAVPPSAYGVYGFGRFYAGLDKPMFDVDPTDPTVYMYTVLHN